MNCGRAHDFVIEQHQLARPKKVLAFPNGESDCQDDEVHFGAESFIMRAACRRN
jgi:hypothetical protein